MFSGYLAIDGIEVLNGARASAYITELMPKIDIECDYSDLAGALGHSAYTTPTRDKAPWYQGARAATGRFLGLFPSKIEGAEDSTRTVEATETSGHGAVMTSPRYGSREIRVVVDAFALDEEAMGEGLAWLREVLAGDGCSDADGGCLGRTVRMYLTMPRSKVSAHGLAREFFDAEVIDAPRVKKKLPSKAGAIWQIEFLIRAGKPWAFTLPASVGQLAMDDGLNHQDAPGENCSDVPDPYSDFVNDPYFTAISRPPQPPTILPPNVLDISSWRRRVQPLPTSHTMRWGRTVPVVRVYTENAIQYLRLRFYRDGTGLSGCDYDGEFLISYIPASAVLTLDGIRRRATLTLPDGRTVPAGHLLFGSDGTPFMWPTLGCQHGYTMTADLMPGQPGVLVTLETAVRE